jgi:hypothetical protein
MLIRYGEELFTIATPRKSWSVDDEGLLQCKGCGSPPQGTAGSFKFLFARLSDCRPSAIKCGCSGSQTPITFSHRVPDSENPRILGRSAAAKPTKKAPTL